MTSHQTIQKPSNHSKGLKLKLEIYREDIYRVDLKKKNAYWFMYIYKQKNQLISHALDYYIYKILLFK